MKTKNYLWIIMSCAFIFLIFVTGCAPKQAVTTENEIDLEIKDLNDYAQILEEYRNGVLANRNGEKLRTQIMTFSYLEGNRVYFCTTKDKPLYKQLIEFPYVSYCTYPEDWEPVLSLNGKVIFVTDIAVREQALNSNYYAKQNFKTVDNPLLEVFYIDVEIIETYGNEGPNLYKANNDSKT